MPGGRLTQRDRRAIAAGLAEGLNYSEIARRLDRPASTVTREVMRNGGALGYRPERAQAATAQRARRRKSPPVPVTPVDHGPGRDPKAVLGLAEGLGELMVQTGLPRMSARVLACLYTTDTGSLTAAELTTRLRVSPASVSTAVAYLEGQELIRREPGERRRERYVIDDDVWFRAMLASAQMNALLADAAHGGAETLGAATPAGARLAGLGDFLGHVGEDLVRSARHWRRVLAEGATPPGA